MTLRRRLVLSCLLLALGPFAHAGVYDDMLRAINENDNAKVVELLQRGMDINTVDPAGNTLLAIAARNGNLEIIEFLLRNRANILKSNKFGDSPLMLAALKGHLAAVKALAGAGADLDPDGWTPLIYGAFEGHDDVVRYLLDRGARIDARSPNGTSALMAAARNGHASTVKLLLEKGADAALTNDAGETALAVALRAGKRDSAELLRRAARR